MPGKIHRTERTSTMMEKLRHDKHIDPQEKKTRLKAHSKTTKKTEYHSPDVNQKPIQYYNIAKSSKSKNDEKIHQSVKIVYLKDLENSPDNSKIPLQLVKHKLFVSSRGTIYIQYDSRRAVKCLPDQIINCPLGDFCLDRNGKIIFATGNATLVKEGSNVILKRYGSASKIVYDTKYLTNPHYQYQQHVSEKFQENNSTSQKRRYNEQADYLEKNTHKNQGSYGKLRHNKPSSLNRAIKILSRQDISSREQLDILFSDRDIATNLLGKFRGAPYDKNDVLQFLRLYRKALIREIKPKLSKDPTKKYVRLEAVNMLIKHTKQIDEYDRNKQLWFGLILQCAARIREGKKVEQRNKPYCGIYAALKTAWDIKPNACVAHTLTMGKIFFDGSSSARRRVFPLNFKIDDSFVDDLTVCSTVKPLIDKKVKGAFFYEIKPLLDNLGIGYHSIKNNRAIRQIIKKMEQSTQRGNGIWAVVNGNFNNVLSDFYVKHQHKQTRKSFFIPEVRKALNENVVNNSSTHAVELRKVTLIDSNHMEIKLHTWGRTYVFQAPIKDFYKIFSPNFDFHSMGDGE